MRVGFHVEDWKKSMGAGLLVVRTHIKHLDILGRVRMPGMYGCRWVKDYEQLNLY